MGLWRHGFFAGWLTDKFGLYWQIVPEKIGEILKHPKAMAAMMNMVKFRHRHARGRGKRVTARWFPSDVRHMQRHNAHLVDTKDAFAEI
jgi:hypothetical protein